MSSSSPVLKSPRAVLAMSPKKLLSPSVLSKSSPSPTTSKPTHLLSPKKPKTPLSSPKAVPQEDIIKSPQQQQSPSYAAFASGIKKEVSSLEQSEKIEGGGLLKVRNGIVVYLFVIYYVCISFQIKTENESEDVKKIESTTEPMEADVKSEQKLPEDVSSLQSSEDKSNRAVISQEETAQAVTALLGESFDNETITPTTEPMDTSEPAEAKTTEVEDKETQSAVAGIVMDNNEQMAMIDEIRPSVEEESHEDDGKSITASDSEMDKKTSTAPTKGRGRGGRGRGRGGRGRGRGRGGSVTEGDSPMSPPNPPAPTTGRGRPRGSRGVPRGANRGTPCRPTTNTTSPRRKSSSDNKPAASIFDWPEEEEDEQPLATLEQQHQTQHQHSSPTTATTSAPAAPSTQEPPSDSTQTTEETKKEIAKPKTESETSEDQNNPTPAGRRQRRSTGKDSASEDNANTEEKIKAILEKAAKEEAAQKVKEQVSLIDPETGLILPMKQSEEGNYVPMPNRLVQSSQQPSPQPRIQGQPPPRIPFTSPVTILTAQQARAQAPSIISPRPPQPQTQITTPEATVTSAAKVASPSNVTVQLPTQPIPPSEIRKPKQILLEHQQQEQQQQQASQGAKVIPVPRILLHLLRQEVQSICLHIQCQ